MRFFKKKEKPELDHKSRAITVMYLHKAKDNLENELASKERIGEDEFFCANHDIKCLEKAITYLENTE